MPADTSNGHPSTGEVLFVRAQRFLRQWAMPASVVRMLCSLVDGRGYQNNIYSRVLRPVQRTHSAHALLYRARTRWQGVHASGHSSIASLLCIPFFFSCWGFDDRPQMSTVEAVKLTSKRRHSLRAATVTIDLKKNEKLVQVGFLI